MLGKTGGIYKNMNKILPSFRSPLMKNIKCGYKNSPNDYNFHLLNGCDTVIAGFTDIYGRLLGKRFDISFFEDSVLTHGTHGCDYLLACDMEMNPQEGFEFSSWTGGYGDVHLHPDPKTLTKATWLDRTAIVLCDVLNNNTHERISIAPRSILKKQIENTAQQGFHALAASELEYYIYQTSYRDARKDNYNGLRAVGDYMEDYHILQGSRSEYINGQFRRHLRDSGIPVESSKGEAGIGQHELNVRYSGILEQADRHVLYKQCLKEVADFNEISVTFMAKPFVDSTGSGCHIHLSLWNNEGENVFVGDKSIGKCHNCSDIFKWFLGGWIHRTPEIFPFYAPTINSYKRFVTSSWAPTKLAWSFDNRTAGFRIVGKDKSLRIEMRICGADVNPYLVFAGSLASGMDGIKNKTEPPKPFDGNIYTAKDAKQIPSDLKEAVKLFRESEWARNTFGNDVVDHYAHFYDLENKSFQKYVTDWERKRYFEMI